MKKLILILVAMVLIISSLTISVSYADTDIVSPFEYVTVCIEYDDHQNTIVLIDTHTAEIYVPSNPEADYRRYVNLPYSAFYHVFNVVVYQDVAQSGVDPDGYNVPYVYEALSFAPHTDITNSVGTPLMHSDTSFFLDETYLRDGKWCLVRLRNTLRVSAIGGILTENRELEHQLSSVTADRDYLQGLLSSQDKPSEMVSFLGNVFYQVGTFFQIEIFPNITIGTIVAIPLIFGAIFLVLHFVRGA